MNPVLTERQGFVQYTSTERTREPLFREHLKGVDIHGPLGLETLSFKEVVCHRLNLYSTVAPRRCTQRCINPRSTIRVYLAVARHLTVHGENGNQIPQIDRASLSQNLQGLESNLQAEGIEENHSSGFSPIVGRSHLSKHVVRIKVRRRDAVL